MSIFAFTKIRSHAALAGSFLGGAAAYLVGVCSLQSFHAQQPPEFAEEQAPTKLTCRSLEVKGPSGAAITLGFSSAEEGRSVAVLRASNGFALELAASSKGAEFQQPFEPDVVKPSLEAGWARWSLDCFDRRCGLTMTRARTKADTEFLSLQCSTGYVMFQSRVGENLTGEFP